MSGSKKPLGNIQVLTFMVVLCFVCALILSTLATLLKEPQLKAEEFDRSKEMLMAANLYSSKGHFLMKDASGQRVPAQYDMKKRRLVPMEGSYFATPEDVAGLYETRIRPFLVDAHGRRSTFKNEGIDEATYVSDHMKTGYGHLPWKLVYEISPNGVFAEDMEAKNVSAEAYLFAVNGFGLWGPIYGYIGLEADGDTVRGISWYKHVETPGLGAKIADSSWQKQFLGKKIFLSSSENRDKAPLGLTVVRGKVIEVYGTTAKADSAVDGMAGATLTGNGVTDAYKNSLSPYRPFFKRLEKGNISKSFSIGGSNYDS